MANYPDYDDPVGVSPALSLLVLNLLAKHCNFGTSMALKNDSMGALIQGLRMVYEEHGWFAAWQVNNDATAQGNPLIHNRDIYLQQRAHRVHLSKIGAMSIKSRPITAAIVCDIAAKFWHNGDDSDILLHALLVTSLNLGLRFDEVSKLQIGLLSIDTGGIRLTLRTQIKNSTVERKYEIDDWPGITPLRGSLFMDPYCALMSWLLVRGPRPGYVFCHMAKNGSLNVLDTNKALSSDSFTKLLRNRLSKIAVADEELQMYTGHSLKRGSLQLYRSSGLRDEHVKEKVQMTGNGAYSSYCEQYNDCAPKPLPLFNSVDEFLAHACRIQGEREILTTLNDENFYLFLSSLSGTADHASTED